MRRGYQPTLAQVFSFDAVDLAANRAGQLSPDQAVMFTNMAGMARRRPWRVLVLLAFARALASRYGCPLRLVSFAVHLSPPEVARFNTESGQVLAEWTENIYAAAHRALGDHPDETPQIVIARGEQWAEAFGTVDWEAGELLVVGSSEAGPIERVFLGSRATKIVRHSPVPVLVVPRAATDNPANLH